MYGDAELVPYDGRNVADILNKLHQDAMTSATARYEKKTRLLLDYGPAIHTWNEVMSLWQLGLVQWRSVQ